MILTTHTLTGAVIGKNIQNPFLVIVFSLTIHFILDSFRHGEYFDSRVATIKNTWWKIVLDLFLGLSLIFIYIYFHFQSIYFYNSRIINILIGSFFSIFPDFLTVLFWKFGGKILTKIKDFHSFCHNYSCSPRFSPERQWTLRNAQNDILFSLLAIILLFI